MIVHAPVAGTQNEYKHGGVPERPKGADCKSVVDDFDGSNPSPSTKLKATFSCEKHTRKCSFFIYL